MSSKETTTEISQNDDYLEKRRVTRKQRMRSLANSMISIKKKKNPTNKQSKKMDSSLLVPDTTVGSSSDDRPTKAPLAAKETNSSTHSSLVESNEDKPRLALAPGMEPVQGEDNVVRPGAMRIEGYAATESQENDELFDDLEANNNNGITEPSFPSLLVEAKLVEEDDRKGFSEQERMFIETQTRQQILGNIVHAEVLDKRPRKEEGVTNRKRRRWIIITFFSVLFLIVVGTVVGVMLEKKKSNDSIQPAPQPTVNPTIMISTEVPSTLSPTTMESSSPSSIPLDNRYSGQAHQIEIGSTVSGEFTDDHGVGTVYCEREWPHIDNPPSLFYRLRGDNSPVKAITNAASVHVLSTNTGCLAGALYSNSGVQWYANSGTDYLVQVSSGSSYSNNGPDFELTIARNDVIENAFPIDQNYAVKGSISPNSAIKDSTISSCGSASSPVTQGAWYIVRGNGYAISASICSGTNFNAQLSVFSSTSNGSTECQDGTSTGCKIVWASDDDTVYYVLVHGLAKSDSGEFLLGMTTGDPQESFVPSDYCGTAETLEIDNTTRTTVDLSKATADAEMGTGGIMGSSAPSMGLYYRIIGNGENIISSLVGYEYDVRDSIYVKVFRGSCSTLQREEISQVTQDAGSNATRYLTWASIPEGLYYLYIYYHKGYGNPEPRDPMELTISSFPSS